MKRVATSGFTLVEILIVVIILGILAAIVIPQFTEASQDARVSSLMTNLQTIRSQVLLYKAQHLEVFPGAGGADFADQMTEYSDQNGNTNATPSTSYPYGPYLQSVPKNPVSNDDAVRIITDGSTTFSAPTADAGWWFNTATGEFRADLKDGHTTTDGTKMNEL